jgi:predicted phage baseplate assembly protein
MSAVEPGCGPCGEPVAATPRPISNPPGRTALDARIGTHSSFLTTTLAALGREPALAPLTTREPDDPTIALLDAAAAILDVLTFYRERITNEGYLATAGERRSVLELAGAIGYELNPGVAAETSLAFTLETAEGSPAEVTMPAGTRAQSVPGQGQQPKIFETTVGVVARPEWNALPGRTTAPDPPARGDTELVLAGTATNLARGDRIVLVGHERENDPGSGRWDVRVVVAVEPHEADPTGGPAAHTVVTIDRPLGQTDPFVDPSSDHPAVYVLRTRAALFGHNALAFTDLPLPLRVGEIHPQTGAFIPGPYRNSGSTWADQTLAPGTKTLFLDQPYDAVTADAWLVLSTATNEELYRVTAAVEEVHSAFLLSGPSTRVGISGEHTEFFAPKSAVVWAGSERIELADPPRTSPIEGTHVPLDVAVEGLEPGRLVAVSGLDAESGEPVAEVRAVSAVLADGACSTLVLDRALLFRYVPATVRVNANVAPATHGESWSETLGGGEARRPRLRFKLANGPLTYTRAATPSGGQSTLLVRVGAVRWNQVDSLYGQLAGAPVYTVRHADDGSATVEFGPSTRPPTGSGNITAAYRVGVGAAGNVAANAITIPLSRPLGLRGLTNPVAATGGADSETMAHARENAPLPIRALGRVVSLDDFQSFAAAYAGIAKARADAVWNGERRVVYLTVASEDAKPAEPGDASITNLVAAVDAARHVDVPVVVSGYEQILVAVAASLDVDPRYAAADVLAAAAAALAAAFSFPARELARPVRLSELLAVLHGVAGVVGVILTDLHPSGGSGRADVAALPARWVGSSIAPAQLAVVDPAAVALTERVR